ncbi:hypothetical protein O6H91_10G050800 [Diphasiastrum complanatum]|uniref:Uncharacterized protein n=1 Tax=Diphasiastrum complanatum TaxID=34168 RepID=A0ACC2CH37_DIPCM|nr:hypothetical protein O6H91_10G050800 [Diphasiastrum complanatum]
MDQMLDVLCSHDKHHKDGDGHSVAAVDHGSIASRPAKNQLHEAGSNGAPSSTLGKEMTAVNVGVDELLANAGYKVRASELQQVAQRLEHLETVLGAAQEAALSHLSTEAVHYNPSDLASWIECMLEELAPNFPVDSLPHLHSFDQSAQVSGCLMDDPQACGRQNQQSHQEDDAHSNIVDYSEEFILDYEETQYGSGFNDHNLNGIFGNICSLEQLGRKREAGMKQGFELNAQGMHQREQKRGKHSITQPCAYSGSSQEAYSQTSDNPVVFSSVYGSNQASLRPMGSCIHQPTLLQDGSDGAQESGVRLVHLLLACAESVQRDDLIAAEELVRDIRVLAAPQKGPMRRVATEFVEALARRIYSFNSQDTIGNQRDSLSELLHFHFYETCPYLKFAHFTANQAILEAFENQKQVHVIDFNLMHGLQWPALIQALALRPEGPPFLRITGIGPPQPGGNDVLQEIGVKLAQLAKSVNVEFDFRGVIAAKLDDVKPWMLQVSQGEAVAVNSIMQLHRLLYSENSATPPPIVEVLQSVKSLNPRIVTIVEHEAIHNSPIFLERFTEALHYYSTMFDSLEACNLPAQSLELMLAETYLGREICNIVACEGAERVERHEPLAQWQMRMCNSGFQPLHLGSNAFKQARMLLTLFSGEGYAVEETGGCLTLGWQSRPLLAASAWRC